MTTDIEKQFFEAFVIPHKVRKWCQYNYAQAERGLEIFPERKKLEDQGLITITHSMLNPRPENDCVYWEELHYPKITDSILLELIVISNRLFPPVGDTLEEIKEQVLFWATEYKEKLYDKVRNLFEVTNDK